MARRVDTIRTPSYLLVSVGNSGLVGNGPPLGRSEAISRLKEVRLTMREGYRTARRPHHHWRKFGPACRRVTPRHFPVQALCRSHVRGSYTWLISSGNEAKGPMSSRVKTETKIFHDCGLGKYSEKYSKPECVERCIY